MGLRRIDVGAAGRVIAALLLGCASGCHPAPPQVVVDVGGQKADAAPKPSGECGASGYCWENPLPSSGFLNAVWSSGPNDVYVAGGGGRILHFDGTSWTSQPGADDTWINGLWGSGPDDVYAVGDSGAVLHRKGGKWQTVDAGTSSYLEAAWGTGPDDVYAVGDSGAIVHWDGQAWSAEDSGTNAHLQAIWGSGPHDVYAAGFRGAQSEGVVVHYDGASWSEQSLGKWLCGVWGTGPDDVWIAGADERDRVAMWKLSSSEWKPVRVPKAGRPMSLTGVGGKPVLLGMVDSAPGDLIGMGTELVFVLEEKGGLFERRDLLTVSRPIGQPNWAIWGGAQGSAMIAGWWGVTGKLDAKGFQPLTGNAALGKTLQAVWGSSPTEVIAVGAAGTILRWDGKSWSPESVPRIHEYTHIYGANGVFAASAREGVLAVRRKGQWKELATGTPDDLWSVWTNGDEIFASGALGTVVRCQAERCETMATGTKSTLWDIWGRSPTEVYAIGERGVLLRWDGSSWKLQSVPKGMDLTAIGPDGSGGVMGLTFDGTYKLEDGAWRRVASEGGWALADGGDGEIRAVYGGGGAPSGVRRWDGKKWQDEPLPTKAFDETAGRLEGIWASGGEVFVVGSGGAILHRRP